MPAGHPNAQRYPGVEFREIKANVVEGYLTRTQLAAVLDCVPATVQRFIQYGLFKPDFYNRKAVFFSIDRIEELKSKWENRLSAFPDSEPVKGVITPFGMMQPRIKPKKEVLARLIQSRPKRRSRDSSWKTRKHYNLADLS